MIPVTCSVEGCEKKVNARGWCSMHLSRWQRHGSLEKPANRARRVCGVEGCDETRWRSGYCANHAARYRRHGDPLGGIYKTGSYTWIHKRLKDERGPAAEHACVDCGGPALDWSYAHGCPDEKTATLGTRGTVVPFCTHLTCYQPRCRRCHRQFDTTPDRRVQIRA